MPPPHDRQAHDRQADYGRLATDPRFGELRRRYRGFVFPATAAFLVWYLLYVVLSMWAPGLMGRTVVGNVNVALVLGILQFVTTFLLAWLYSRFSAARLDPLAGELLEDFEMGERR